MPWRSRMAWAWTLAILALCWFPAAYMGGVEEDGGRPFPIPHLDKVVHLGIFAVFAFLGMKRGASMSRILVVLASGAALAALTEAGQASSLVGRDASWQDGLADLVGVVVGLAAWTFAGRPEWRRPGDHRVG